MTLALPIRHPDRRDQTLLKVGYELTTRTLTRLRDIGIHHFWIRYPGLEFVSDFVHHEVLEGQYRVVHEITDTFEDLQKDATAKLSYRAYCEAIGDLITQLIRNPKAAIFLDDLLYSQTDDLIRHSSSVAYLSVLIGLKLQGYLVRQRPHIPPSRAKQVINLGLGAMLHDVGMVQLHPDVRQRYRDNGDESDLEWREHTALGYEMVHGQIEPSAATVVLNHHQRFDGSGYAGQNTPVLSGERIHVFSRIVGLADQFDRVRHPVNLPAQQTVWVLHALLEDPMLKKFDPQVMRALLSVVPPYPPGSIVRLSDGRWAVAIDHVPHDPCRPVVQIIPDPAHLDPAKPGRGQVIDLSEHARTLLITQCDGYDVTDLDFPAPELMRDRLDNPAGV